VSSEQTNSPGLELSVMTFGKSCKRCNVYFITRNRLDVHCPWCTRVELGQYHEEEIERPDDLKLVGL